MLDDGPALNDYTDQVKKCLDSLAGKKRNTIKAVFYTLRRLNREVDLMNPETVKKHIGNLTKKDIEEDLDNATKRKYANCYNYFVIVNGLSWEKPTYTLEEKIPPAPTKEQAEAIIASAPSLNSATIFRILLETGFEGEELYQESL